MSQNRLSDEAVNLDTTFAERLLILIGTSSVSAFARKVALSESLIRKYLKGSEPSLTRAHQIAQQTNVSLDWLATGFGSALRQIEVVDTEALSMARSVVMELEPRLHRTTDQLTIIVSVYQYLLESKADSGGLDEKLARQFVFRLIER